MSALIIYKDVAIGAKESSTPAVSEKQIFVDINDLKKDVQPLNYGTLERDYFLLDGSFYGFPDKPQNMGWYSEQLSGDADIDGVYPFESNITLIRTFPEYYTSSGITVVFDTYNQDYCKDMTVSWYKDNELLKTRDCIPDQAEYFCECTVELFNKIIIEFRGMNKPNRYLKVFCVDDGVSRYFGGDFDDQLMSCGVVQKISPIGEELEINSLDFEVHTKTDADYIFQKKQPFFVYQDSRLVGVFYCEDSIQSTRYLYSVNAECCIGLLDKVQFMGGFYMQKRVPELIEEVMRGEIIGYWLDPYFDDKIVSGYLPICTKREALQQIAFAIGAIADTSNSSILKIYSPPEGEPKAVDEELTFSGGTKAVGDIYTAVKVTAHNYILAADSTELFNNTLNGTATVEFSNAYRDLEIFGGTILESGANFAKISGTGGIVLLKGKVYNDVQTVYTKENPNITAGMLENVLEVTDATLVTQDNVNEVVERVYNHYLRNESIQTPFVIRDEGVGDKVTIQTDFSGRCAGRLISLDLSLNGSKLIGTGEVLLDG